jgi:Fur family iron response transcriptional regulator
MHQATAMPAKARAREMLRSVGLRPTRQRLDLAQLIFAGGDRHLSAEVLHRLALDARISVSLATIYNTLHQFTEVGLLREIVADGTRTFFDTNTREHQHFFVEDEGEVIDIADGALTLDEMPAPPPGYEVVQVDVVVKLRRIGGPARA